MARSTTDEGEPAADSRCAAAVHRDAATLEAVADEWEDLWARCPSATPFQARAWQTSWWREYGKPGALRLVLVRRAGLLVGVGAFHRRVVLGVPVLAPLGGHLSDWTDVLVDPAHEMEALDALTAALLAEPGWRVLDLPEVRADATALRWTRRWPGAVRLLPASVCADMPVAPLDDVVAAMSPSARQSVRRALRKIDREGLVETTVTGATVADAVDRLLALHREQWKARGGMNPEHGRPRFARHLHSAVAAMTERKQAILTTYTLDGEVVAANLMLAGYDVVGGYLFGARPELFERFNVMAMLMRTALGAAGDRGVGTFSMLRGRESYKSVWNTEPAGNERVLLGRPGRPAGIGYAAAVQGRALLVARLRTHAPAVRAALLKLREGTRNPKLALRRLTRR